MIELIKHRYRYEVNSELLSLLNKWTHSGAERGYEREDYYCNCKDEDGKEHGAFHFITVAGQPFPDLECPKCRAEYELKKAIQDAMYSTTFKLSGLYQDQKKLKLKDVMSTLGRDLSYFWKEKDNFVLVLAHEDDSYTEAVCALVADVCRLGKQAVYITSNDLMKRIKGSWQRNSDAYLDTLSEYPLLVIDHIDDDKLKDWYSNFLESLLYNRERAKKKTILLSEDSVQEKLSARTQKRIEPKYV